MDPNRIFEVEGALWDTNHGHRLLDDGRFVFFNNGPFENPSSRILEYELDEPSMTARRVREYARSADSAILGDVQRLPSGNTLVTISESGLIIELDPSGAIARQFVAPSNASAFGYSSFRRFMYGPPMQ